MPKARRSNERRRNRRLRARKDWHGGPTLSVAAKRERLYARPRRPMPSRRTVHRPTPPPRTRSGFGQRLRDFGRRLTGRRGS